MPGKHTQSSFLPSFVRCAGFANGLVHGDPNDFNDQRVGRYFLVDDHQVGRFSR